jgi:hypothetical protein
MSDFNILQLRAFVAAAEEQDHEGFFLCAIGSRRRASHSANGTLPSAAR